MIKQNRHIEEYLNAYRKMDDVDFAVMITGSWGCGKTHFITDYLKRKCTTEGEKKYIYISLNGISSTADIDMAIFQAAHPVLGSKAAVMAGKIVKASLRTGLKINLDIDGDDKTDATGSLGIPMDSFKLKTKSKFLVFDDLERCILKPEEVLGYINAFVESKETKVIIIGDETQIGSSQSAAAEPQATSEERAINEEKKPSDKYWVIKEKVIGKTFKLTENIEEILSDLITEKAYPKTFVLILNNRSAVISVFKRVNDALKDRHNYRALKHAFRDFEYFYSFLAEEHRQNHKFIADLFAVFLSFSYELQLKTITTDDVEKLHIPDYLLPSKKSGEKTRLDEFVARHSINRLNWVLPVDIWCTILKNEPIDKAVLVDIISSSDYFRKEAELPDWKKLQEWWSLQDDACVDAIASVRTGLIKQKFDTPQMILHVFGVMLELANYDLIQESKTEILQEAIQYIDDLRIDGNLQLPDQKFDYDLTDGLVANRYSGYQYAEFEQLHKTMIHALAAARMEEQKSQVPDILAVLKRDPDEFRQMIGVEGDWFPDPILSLINPSDFHAKLLSVSNHELFIVEDALKRRYQFIQNFQGLVVELDFLIKLRELINADLKTHGALKTPSIHAFERLRTKLDKLIDLLEQNLKNTASADNTSEMAP